MQIILISSISVVWFSLIFTLKSPPSSLFYVKLASLACDQKCESYTLASFLRSAMEKRLVKNNNNNNCHIEGTQIFVFQDRHINR